MSPVQASIFDLTSPQPDWSGGLGGGEGGSEATPRTPLGTITGFAAKYLHNTEPKSDDFVAIADESGRLARAERYELQAVARGVLPGHRIAGCLRHRRPGARVEIRQSQQSGLAYYSGLLVCGRGSVCPCCGAKIAEHNCGEIQTALDAWGAREGVPALMTFTMPHYASQWLRDNLAALLGAFRDLTRHGSYRKLVRDAGLTHSIKAVEVTWGQRNGFHPHLHVLGFFESGRQALRLGDAVSALWFSQLHRQGVEMRDASAVLKRGFRFQLGFSAGAEYVSKVGQTWGLAEEVAKANRKKGKLGHLSPADLLRMVRDHSSPSAAAVYREYAGAVKGLHMLQWSRGARADLLGDVEDEAKSDEEIAAGVDQADVVLAGLSAREWVAVRHGGWRSRLRLLELADFDTDAALAYVRHLVSLCPEDLLRRV